MDSEELKRERAWAAIRQGWAVTDLDNGDHRPEDMERSVDAILKLSDQAYKDGQRDLAQELANCVVSSHGRIYTILAPKPILDKALEGKKDE